MFRVEPPNGFAQKQVDTAPANLKGATNFIAQTISAGNKLLEKEYLTLPDEKTLKFIYAIRQTNYNLRKENATDNNLLLDSLSAAPTPRNSLIACYYGVLFGAVGNKNQPFNFSKSDFKPNEYGLLNDTEKGIFFLECMQLCGTTIWGYMNIVKPPNTEKAYGYIRKFPKFNGLKYFQYNDLNFPDFQLIITQKEGMQSFKSYYIDKYYELLFNHLICLRKEEAKEKEVNDLMLGSILKDRTLYKYSKHKEILERMFEEQKQ